MPRAPRGHLEGMKGCREALQALSKGVQRNVGKRALRPAAQYLADRVAATLPVSTDPSNKTPGSLKAAPTVVAAKTEKGRPRVAMLIDDVAAVPGEFGTSKMKPHLKVRATVDASREGAAVIMGESLKVEVDAAAQRAARKAAKG